MRSFKLVIILLLVFLSVSCISEDVKIEFKRDLSGTADVVYTVPLALVNTTASSTPPDPSKYEPLLPVPYSREVFEMELGEIDGIRLVSYDSKTTDTDMVISARLAFDNPDALSEWLSAGGQTLTVVQSNGSYEMSLKLFSPEDIPQDKETVDFINTFFSDYGFKLKITVFAPVSYTSAGVADGRTVSLEAPISDVILGKIPDTLVVRW
ncbi:hypothetical protein WKV44_05200 [Spirochaetia bacterium 38H-sp]|uniref:Lipoprotein n=1 Tax=Rarispira pelagica TaxID=3141764 RepID=A0ABU9UB89_9SPIR